MNNTEKMRALRDDLLGLPPLPTQEERLAGLRQQRDAEGKALKQAIAKGAKALPTRTISETDISVAAWPLVRKALDDLAELLPLLGVGDLHAAQRRLEPIMKAQMAPVCGRCGECIERWTTHARGAVTGSCRVVR